MLARASQSRAVVGRRDCGSHPAFAALREALQTATSDDASHFICGAAAASSARLAAGTAVLHLSGLREGVALGVCAAEARGPSGVHWKPATRTTPYPQPPELRGFVCSSGRTPRSHANRKVTCASFLPQARVISARRAGTAPCGSACPPRSSSPRSCRCRSCGVGQGAGTQRGANA